MCCPFAYFLPWCGAVPQVACVSGLEFSPGLEVSQYEILKLISMLVTSVGYVDFVVDFYVKKHEIGFLLSSWHLFRS